MSNPITAINPTTGVEYNVETGQSVKRYVAVVDGQVLNPAGVQWPFLNGLVHDQAFDFYEIVPFQSVPYDPEYFRVDDIASGWNLVPIPDAPQGHPKGTYQRTEVIIRRSKAELRTLVEGYAARAQAELWPQAPGYAEMLAYAKEQVAANNQGQEFRDLIDRHELLMSATFANQSRLNQLYAEIEEAGETGPIDFIASEGWVNGIQP
jgi:hypothetical protein